MKQLWKLVGVVLVLTLVAVGCTDSGDGLEVPTGDGDIDEETIVVEQDEPEVTDISAGVIPIFDVVPLNGALAEGSFEDVGLEVTTSDAAGGAAIVPGVVAGDFQVGFSNVYSVMQAAEQGLDLRIIAAGSFVGGPDEDISGLLSIEFDSLEQLEGSTVAVNTLGNLVEVNVRETMDQAGLDADSVEFVEIAFPDMVGALESGQVQAIAPVEPFVGVGIGIGANQLAAPFSAAQPNMMQAVWFTTGEFAEANPNTVAAFVEVLNASFEKAQNDRDYANELVVEYTATPDLAAAEQTTLPVWRSELDVASLETSALLGVKWGVLESEPDVGALVG